MRKLLPFLASIGSGVLLAMAYAPASIGELTWFILVPWILACRHATPRKAILLSWLCGCAFWFTSMPWLTRVTFGGYSALSLYCAIYFIPLGWFTAKWFGRNGAQGKQKNIVYALLGASVWTASEFARTSWLTGFAWNTLAISQHENISVIQIAELGGTYAVSFLVILFNLGIASTWLRYREREKMRMTWHPEIALPLLLIALSFAFGMTRLKPKPSQGTQPAPLEIISIQPAIPQDLKWGMEEIINNYRLHLMLSQEAIDAYPNAHLVIWPETAVPLPAVRLIWEHPMPLMLGALDWTPEEEATGKMRNSSMLFKDATTKLAHYDKQHLVMFGEYVPFRKQLPFLGNLSPIPEDCVPGKESGLFPIRETYATPLICFEDTMPYLARKAVKRGARLLVIQTNDAWFDPKAGATGLSAALRGSPQHRAHLIFRCIENRVPAVCCANSGSSGVVNKHGVFQLTSGRNMKNPPNDYVLKEEPYGLGYVVSQVEVIKDHKETLYTRYGDLFAWLCALVGAFSLLWAWRIKNSKPSSSSSDSGS